MENQFQEQLNTIELLKRAYEFAHEVSKAKKRENGDPLITHALATAERLSTWNLDCETIAAGLLHDVPDVLGRDEGLRRISRDFGHRISDLIEHVLTISSVSYRGVEQNAENIRNYILYLSKDIRVVLIKLAERIDTLQYLYSFTKAEQKRIAAKTMEVYAPLARQLGIGAVAGDLEDLAFPYVYPREHALLAELVRDRFEERRRYLDEVTPALKRTLDAQQVPILSIHSRAKHYYSLFRKLQRYDMDIEKIYDLVALRIIVPGVEDCYATLGTIHTMWPPLEGRIKDYIATPKQNGYRSLHTTVYATGERLVEVQIRTEQMHHEAEFGVAAHVAYQAMKGSKRYLARAASAASPETMQLTRELRAFPKDIREVEFFRDRIFVLTPKGDVVDLPKDATPVDFAYKIHSDIGDQCAGARINGRISPLSTTLASADCVEILTQKRKRPSESWLEFVKTSQAREHIRESLRTKRSGYAPTSERVHVSVVGRQGLAEHVRAATHGEQIKIETLTSQETAKSGKRPFEVVRLTVQAVSAARIAKLVAQLKGIREVRKVTLH